MKRRARWILGGLGALVLVGAVGVAVLPSVIRWLAVSRWEALTGGRASIERVEVRIRDGRFEFQGVRLSDSTPGPPFIELERMSGALRWEALLRGEFRARAIDITAPTIRLVRTETGELNVGGLFRPSRPTSGGGWLSVRLERAALTRGRIVFEDRAVSPPRTLEAHDITVELRDITSRPGEARGAATVTLAFAGAPVRLEADRIGLAPGEARATLTLGDLDLAPLLAYTPPGAAVTPSRGHLAGRVEMFYDAKYGIRLGGEARVTDLALLRSPQTEPLVAVPALSATWLDVVYREGAVAVGRIELAAEPTVVDGSVTPPLRLTVALRLVAEGLAYPTGPPGRVTLTAVLPRGGALEARGQLDAARRATELAVSLSSVDLTLFSPYLPPGGLLELARGRLGGALSVSATPRSGLGASGELTATDLVLMRRGQAEPFLTHPRLRLTATALTFGDGQLAVRRVALEGAPSVVDASVTPAARLDFIRLGLTADDATWPVQRPWRVTGTGVLVDGGRSTLDGTFDPSTLDTDVRATFTDMPLAPAASYLPRDGVTFIGGRLGARARLRHARATGVRLEADGAVTDLVMGRRDASEPLIRDRRFGFTVRELAIGRGTVALRQGTVTGTPEVTDASVTPPRRMALRGLRLDVNDFAWPLERPARWALGADLPGSGVLSGRGALRDGGRVLDASLELREADLAPLPPWLSINAPLAGKLDADARGTVTFRSPLELAVQGWTRIRDGTLGAPDHPALNLPGAEATGVDVRWPASIRIARVTLDRPSVLFERAEDGSFVIRTMLRSPAEPAPAPAPVPEATSSEAPSGGRSTPALVLDEAVVEDGQLRFVDRSTNPLYSEEISRLALTVSGLTTDTDDSADVALQGVLGTTGAVELRGEIAPWARPFRLELEGELREFQLPRTNPFFRRFFDWLLQRGSLTTKVHYRIVGDRLEATNRVHVQRLDVARDPQPVRAERKIGLPLGLIVAMATDARGDIAFDLPVEGRFGAPGFSFGGAVMAALKNVLVNLVTGPFHAIGRVFRQDDDSIETLQVDPIPFAAGSATIDAEGDRQLGRVADFLRASPNVRLALRPVVTTDDLASIRTRGLTARVQRLQRETQLGSFEAAAAALYARELPGSAVPDGVDEIVARLREREPLPEGAGHELARGRLESARRGLIEGGGIEAGRLESIEDEPEVSGSGPGRVELELAP